MDYSRYLVMYSAGADSTYFVETEPTARHLIHYSGFNEAQTKLAIINANILNRFITIIPSVEYPPRDISKTVDGEINKIHALYDTVMAVDAGVRAMSFGMDGIVMCFNADNHGIDNDSVERIFRRVNPAFKLLMPLIKRSAADIRSARTQSTIKSISCMYSENCGFCPKCKMGY